MAGRGVVLPVLLVAFTLMAGGLMEGVSGSSSSSSSFVRRRMAAHESLGASAVVVPATTCPITCGPPFNPFFPACCQNNAVPGLPPAYFCANPLIDYFNCGRCGTRCDANGYTVGSNCCAGVCTNTFTDPKNCGFCGNKCPALDVCRFGLCSYAGDRD